ncbi:MAG TPA: NAD(P)H-dependent oxidoreductase, partial [Chitinophagaceae bacterium]
MKIEIISGSPRSNSVTKRVALHLYKQLQKNTNHTVDIIDAHEWNLPALQAV